MYASDETTRHSLEALDTGLSDEALDRAPGKEGLYCCVVLCEKDPALRA